MNFYTMNLSDLKYELDKFRRFVNRFGASDRQQNYLKAMEKAYMKRMSKLCGFNKQRRMK